MKAKKEKVKKKESRQNRQARLQVLNTNKGKQRKRHGKIKSNKRK